MTQRTHPPTSPLGPHQKNVTTALTQLARDNVVARIWDKDHTVWKDDPTEITDRLGWLTISRDMTEHVSDLQSFAEEVRGEGVRDVVLLGMGGSSLGPEVLRQCIGSAPGFPALTVLDSTVPERVGTVTRSIDPARALFIVSSKSGGTIEPNSFYKHFRHIVESAVGAERAGRHFVAITDTGTSLAERGAAEGFRRYSRTRRTSVGGTRSARSSGSCPPRSAAWTAGSCWTASPRWPPAARQARACGTTPAAGSAPRWVR